MTDQPFNSPFSRFVRRTLKRPASAILGWGVCGFGISAWVFVMLHSVLFNPDIVGNEKLTQAGLALVGWLCGGALFGTVLFLANRNKKDWDETGDRQHPPAN